MLEILTLIAAACSANGCEIHEGPPTVAVVCVQHAPRDGDSIPVIKDKDGNVVFMLVPGICKEA